jgi:hypothetical protein
MSPRPESLKKIIPFAPTEPPRQESRQESYPPSRQEQRDPMDRSGDTIVALLDRAAHLTHEDTERAMALAHHLSRKLQAAEERAVALEAQVAFFQQRASRAESWLARIHHEINDKLIQRGGQAAARP